MATDEAGPGELDLELVTPDDAAVPLGVAARRSPCGRATPARGAVSVAVALDARRAVGRHGAVRHVVAVRPRRRRGRARTSAVTPAQWFADVGRYDIAAEIAEPEPVAASLSFDVGDPTVVVPEFEDVTAAVGLDDDRARRPSAASSPTARRGATSTATMTSTCSSPASATRSNSVRQRRRRPRSPRRPSRGASSVAGAQRSRVRRLRQRRRRRRRDRAATGRDVLLAQRRHRPVRRRVGDGGHRRRRPPGHRARRGATSTATATSTCTSPTTCSAPASGRTEEEIIANVAYDPDVLYRNDGDGTFSDVTTYLENDPTTATTVPPTAPGSPRPGSTTTTTTVSTCTWRTTSSGSRLTTTVCGATTARTATAGRSPMSRWSPAPRSG